MIESILGGLASAGAAMGLTAEGGAAIGAATSGVATTAETATSAIGALSSVEGVGSVGTGLVTGDVATQAAGLVGSQAGKAITGGAGPMADIGGAIGKETAQSLVETPKTFGNVVANSTPEVANPAPSSGLTSTPQTFGETLTPNEMGEYGMMNESMNDTMNFDNSQIAKENSFGGYLDKALDYIKEKGPEYAKNAAKYAAKQKIGQSVKQAFTPNKVAQAQGRGYEDGQRGSGMQQGQNQRFNMYENYYKQIGGR